MPYKNPEKQRSYYLAHKEEISEKNRLKYLQNKDEIIARVHKYYKEHREEILVKDKIYYNKNKEALKITMRNWVVKNRDTVRRIKRKYKTAHKESEAAYNRKHHNENREHYRKYKRGWCRSNPDKMKNEKLKNRFGITLEQFLSILKTQNNMCGVCGTTLVQPCVDHCHVTGMVRGVLCRGCNSGVGSFKDSPETLHTAIRWIQGNQQIVPFNGNVSDIIPPSCLLKYNITSSEYVDMFVKQGGFCGICGRPLPYKKQERGFSANIDHCHVTGKVRGILCGKCNRGLGLLKDSCEIITKAIEWVERKDSINAHSRSNQVV